MADISKVIIPSDNTVYDIKDATARDLATYIGESSGSIAHFTDGADSWPMQELKIAISPVQDLHGYDNPWPAGGGKNLLDPTYRTNTEQNIQLYFGVDLLLLKANTAYTFSVSVAAAQLTFLKRGGTSVAVNYGKTSLSYTPTEDMYVSLDVYYGGNCPVPSGGVSVVNCQLELGSTATAYSPYSNICPISGWTGARVTRTGKNLFDKSTGIQIQPNNIRVARSEGEGYGVPFKLKKGVTYTLSCNSATSANIYFMIPYSHQFFAQSPVAARSFTYTPTEDIEAGFNFYWLNGRPEDATDIMLEIGDTRHDYVPYSGNTYDISWQTEAGTVYGGTLNVTTGVLTVDRVRALLSDASAWYEVSGNPKFRYSTAFADRKKYNNSYDGLSACSYIQINALEYANTGRWVSSSSDNFGIESSDLTLAQIQQDATDGKIVICYELATHLTYQLTPTQISTLLGTNNIWADTGDIASCIYARENVGILSKLFGLTPSSYSGSAAKVNNHTVAADVPSGAVFTDTTYALSISENRITLTPSSGSATYVDLPVYNGGVSP